MHGTVFGGFHEQGKRYSFAIGDFFDGSSTQNEIQTPGLRLQYDQACAVFQSGFECLAESELGKYNARV
ncbi:hypothetical protein D3C80_1984640 [compost metagenome]